MRSGLAVYRKTQKRQVYESLQKTITDPARSLGERLPGIKELARRFDTSPRTVQSALEELEAKGYVEMRHGSGTFIRSQHRPMTMKDTVAVCMETRAHLYADLAAELVNALNERRLVPLTVDMQSPAAEALLTRMVHAEVECFLVHAWMPDFLKVLESAGVHRLKPIISFVGAARARDWPRLYEVRTDYDAGGRSVARHLHAAGHRRVLLLGPPTAQWEWNHPDTGRNANPGVSFIEEWGRLGGELETMVSESAHGREGQRSEPAASDVPDAIRNAGGVRSVPFLLNEDRFVAALKAPNAPTAVFGIMDLQAWNAQQIIRARLPEREGEIEIVGYYDTPWSRAGSPPLSTVSLELPKMVEAAMAMLETLRAGGEPEEKTVVVTPRLVLR